MVITTSKEEVNIRITICDTEQKSEIKYLVVFIDGHLKADAQIRHINNKVTKILQSYINLHIMFLLTYILKELYDIFIYPYLTYELMSWGYYNTRYATNRNLYRPASRTNYGLARFKVIASKTSETIPTEIKFLSHIKFQKEFKLFLLGSKT